MHKKTILLIFFALIVIMACGCTPSPEDEEQPPEAPSSMAIDNDEGDGQDSTEGQADAAETVDSFIKTTQLVQATDGSAVVQLETESPLDEGTYQARYYDSDGGENSAPCEPVEGADNELRCSIALAGGLQLVEFQLFHQEPFEPFFSAGVDFTGTALGDLFDNVDAYILPPEFQPEDPVGNFDFYLYLLSICKEWNFHYQMPHNLDPICTSIIGEENFRHMPNPFDNLPGHGNSNWATVPDPDCDGVDAGSFWCQETDEQQYLAGRLAHACLSQINTAFEDPLTAFEDPLTAFEDPLTAFEDPLTAFEDPLTAFEDPLTAFEDPLTAFEDPLTAFEDPLTAFEDPLTAFEDPLTAIDVARTTILYRIAAPFLPNAVPLTACNQLALLGDHSQYLRTGQTLLEYLADYYPAFKPISGRIPLDTSELTVMPAHCGYFDDMEFEDRHYLYINSHAVIIMFDAAEPLPGLHYFVFGDPTPYHYSATLGDVDLNCGIGGSTGLRCIRGSLPESIFGQEQEYALYVTGCEEPLHTGVITLPDYDYSRCTVFEEVDMSLYVADPSTNLSIAVEMANGVPGLEVEDYPGFDRLPVNYFSRFCGEQTFCEVYDWSPGLLYCNFNVTSDCLADFNEYELFVDNCPWPILTRTLQIIAPTHGGGVGDEAGSGPAGPTCTGTESTRWLCEGHGGSWSGPSSTTGTCTCP